MIGGYFEDRTEGFTTLDYNVTDATGDETLYGLFLSLDPQEGKLAYNLYADAYENEVGDNRLEIGAEVAAQITDRLDVVGAIEYLDETNVAAGTNGNRVDLALELSYAALDNLDVYTFGQATISNDGLDDNERYSVGLSGTFSNGWEAGVEVSDRRGDFGAEIFAVQTHDDNSSTYFGYELDPGRTLTGVESGFKSSDNGGRYVLGSRRQINENVAVFGENTYDIFGDSRELIGAYGVTYSPNDFLSYTVTYDNGLLSRSADNGGDVDRQAFSFGARYEDEALRFTGRVELRFDENEIGRDTESYFAILDADYRINEETHLIMTLDYADTENNGTSFQEGTFVDVVLGYAHRPINNERLNVLASYRYFYDTVGQEIDGVFDAGPVQESHIVSLEANYDINPNWTVAGKLGGRWTDSAASAGDALESNDAWLGVVNARYHLKQKWDLLFETRHLDLIDAETSETGFLGAAYYHVNNNASVGVGYNFSSFSDDLTDLTFDDDGLFLNLIAKF